MECVERYCGMVGNVRNAESFVVSGSTVPLRPFLFPFLPSVESIRGFAHAAGFAAAWRYLQFLVC